jgi:proteasome accessory factor PafA2
MAIPKVCGIETEYGIVASGNNMASPINASSFLINAYVTKLQQEKPKWDFEDETPAKDARGFVADSQMALGPETHLVNSILTNGARYYVDHAHPEFSTPECASPLELVIWDKAGEAILNKSIDAAYEISDGQVNIAIYKNNSDKKGNSYGCHENYLVDRALDFNQIVTHLTPHLVTRQIYCGAGKLGCEVNSLNIENQVYQISQRADFFEELVGLETTIKRPIINTRDEPHANPAKYRRLHVIIGDANISQVATFLKVGTTAVILAMIEDAFIPNRNLEFLKPVKALKEISFDLKVNKALEMADGTTMSALEVQWELFDHAKKYINHAGSTFLGGDQVSEQLLSIWENVLTGLESDPMELEKDLDWVAKYQMISHYRERHNLNWDSHKLGALDLQYHDIRPERSLAGKLKLKSLVEQADIDYGVENPPDSTRAYFRGNCLRYYGSSILTANWDSIVFDLGKDPLRRVPMMEPLKGSKAHVSELFAESKSAADLLDKLDRE